MPLSKKRFAPYEIQNLFIEDRKEHLKELIIPNLNLGKNVCTDRYALSMIVYGSVNNPKNAYELVKRHENQGIIKPDLTILIDTEPEIAFRRILADSKDRRTEEMFDKLEYLKKIRELYLDHIRIFTKDCIIIDGNPPIEEVFREIKGKFISLNI